MDRNAKAVLRENDPKQPKGSEEYLRSRVIVPSEPVIIYSSENIGTRRARANHVDTYIDYCREQEKLKELRVPL